MKDEDLQNMDLPAKTADTSIPKMIEVTYQGKTAWLDWDLFVKQQEFMKQKEAEMWEARAKFQKELYGDTKCWCEDGKERPKEDN